MVVTLFIALHLAIPILGLIYLGMRRENNRKEKLLKQALIALYMRR